MFLAGEEEARKKRDHFLRIDAEITMEKICKQQTSFKINGKENDT